MAEGTHNNSRSKRRKASCAEQSADVLAIALQERQDIFCFLKNKSGMIFTRPRTEVDRNYARRLVLNLKKFFL